MSEPTHALDGTSLEAADSAHAPSSSRTSIDQELVKSIILESDSAALRAALEELLGDRALAELRASERAPAGRR